MNKPKSKTNDKWSILFKFAGVAFIFVVWFIYSAIKVSQGNNENLFPSPIIVFEQFFKNFGDKLVWSAFGWSILRLAIGFGIAFVAAGLLGIIAAVHQRFYEFLKPLVSVLKSIPTAAITFIILIRFGYDWTPCVLVFMVVFPIVYEGFVTGLHSADKSVVESAELNTKRDSLNMIIHILLPSSMPYVLLSTVTSIGVAIKVSVMSEIVVGGSSANGIGRLIYISNSIDFNIPNIYALSILTIIIILIIDSILAVLKKEIQKNR